MMQQGRRARPPANAFPGEKKGEYIFDIPGLR
jgi:hypothetical protein